MSATLDDVLKALEYARRAQEGLRDSLIGQMGEMRGDFNRLASEVHEHGRRISLLEESEAKRDSDSRVPSEVSDLLDELRKANSHREFLTQLRKETDEHAAELESAARRRRSIIAWGLGILFTAAQTAQLVRSLWH